LKTARWTSNAFETDSCPLLVEQKYSKRNGRRAHLAAAPCGQKKKSSILPSAQAIKYRHMDDGQLRLAAAISAKCAKLMFSWLRCKVMWEQKSISTNNAQFVTLH